MTSPRHPATLGERQGRTVSVSPMWFRLEALRQRYPCSSTSCLEDWLIRVANARGATVVVPNAPPDRAFLPPSPKDLPNTDLIVALCHLRCEDRPQMLRLAAQLISRNTVDLNRLQNLARRERTESVLAGLARLALHVDPAHDVWRAVLNAFASAPTLREPLLHWTRLATPVMANGRIHGGEWKLTA